LSDWLDDKFTASDDDDTDEELDNLIGWLAPLPILATPKLTSASGGSHRPSHSEPVLV
jgi:hypothetical protein